MTSRGTWAGGSKRAAGGVTSRRPMKRTRTVMVPAWGTPRIGRRAAGTGSAELKFHDIDVDQAAADWSAGKIANGGSVCLIGQGVTESTRVGRKCVIKNINWRGTLKKSAAAGASVSDQTVTRVMFYLDKQANGATAAVTDILVAADAQAFNNLNNKGRFLILMDKRMVLIPQASAGDGAANDTGAVFVPFTFFKSCNIPLEFSGTAAPSVIGEVRSNNLGILLISEEAGGDVALNSKLRLRFADG